MFLMLARAAMEGAPSPGDEALARAYGSRSPSRGRWLLTYMEERGYLACEADFRGNRVVRFPAFGWKTHAGEPARHGGADKKQPSCPGSSRASSPACPVGSATATTEQPGWPGQARP